MAVIRGTALLALGALLIGAGSADALTVGVSGNHLVDANGKQVRLIGVNRSGSEYSCSGDDGAGGNGYGFSRAP